MEDLKAPTLISKINKETSNSKKDSKHSISNDSGTQDSYLKQETPSHPMENPETSTLSARMDQETSPSNPKVDQETSTSRPKGDQETSNSSSKEDQETPTSNSTRPRTQETPTKTKDNEEQETSILYEVVNFVFTKECFNSLAAFFVGCEASRSKQAFCLVLFSFLGGSEYGQRVPVLTLLNFVGGFSAGVGPATIYLVLLSCFIAYACELNHRDAVLVGFTFLFGLLCNVSDQAFFLVVYSYLGGVVVRYDKEALIYMGLSFLLGSTGTFNFLAIPFSLRF